MISCRGEERRRKEMRECGREEWSERGDETRKDVRKVKSGIKEKLQGIKRNLETFLAGQLQSKH